METLGKINSFFRSARRFLESLANLLDLFRVIPRVLMLLYCWILYNSTLWFQALEDPNGAQSAFISVVYGAAAGLFGLYVGKDRQTKKIIEEEAPPPPMVTGDPPPDN